MDLRPSKLSERLANKPQSLSPFFADAADGGTGCGGCTYSFYFYQRHGVRLCTYREYKRTEIEPETPAAFARRKAAADAAYRDKYGDQPRSVDPPAHKPGYRPPVYDRNWNIVKPAIEA
jgi:hypothetical protein